MKRFAMVFLILIIGLCLVNVAVAADKAAIQKQVDDIVIAIDNGKTAQDFMSAAQNKPYYVFIMEEKGTLLVKALLGIHAYKIMSEQPLTKGSSPFTKNGSARRASLTRTAPPCSSPAPPT